MKKIIAFFIITTVLCKITLAQTDTTVNIIKPIVKDSDYYLKQTSNLNTTGAVLLVIGLGTLVATSYSWISGYGNLNGGVIISLVGLAGSIPCFISAQKNRKKAKLLLKEEQVSISSRTGLRMHSIGIRIDF